MGKPFRVSQWQALWGHAVAGKTVLHANGSGPAASSKPKPQDYMNYSHMVTVLIIIILNYQTILEKCLYTSGNNSL